MRTRPENASKSPARTLAFVAVVLTTLAACGGSTTAAGNDGADGASISTVAESAATSVAEEQTTTDAPPLSIDDPEAALLSAIQDGDAELATAALEAGADPNRETLGNPILSIAAENGPVEVVAALLDAGAEVDRLGKSDNTPLMRAVFGNQPEVTQLLIDSGASLDLVEASTDRFGLIFAIDGLNGVDAMVVLLDNGADINQLDRRGDNALAAAAFVGDAEAANILIERGIDVNQENTSGLTPLGWALQQEDEVLIEILLAAGATE